MRTENKLIFDYNPSESSSWLYELPKDESILIKSTYRDNPFLPDSIKRQIEDLKRTDEALYQIYALGEKAISKSNIYSNWNFINHRPSRFVNFVYGLDFGYSNDPTSIIEVYTYNGQRILNEICYQKGLSNSQIAKYITTKLPCYCDSAEPKSIDELKSYGVKAYAVTKGSDSINFGIQVMQEQDYLVTSKSVNLTKELRKYAWDKDKKTNEKLNKPIDNYNHAIDATRYHEMETVGLRKSKGKYDIR
jgi:phage terminase large subunit